MFFVAKNTNFVLQYSEKPKRLQNQQTKIKWI